MTTYVVSAELYSTSIANPSLGKALIGTPEAQAASNADDHNNSGFGCGSIYIKKDGSSGPTDMGGKVSLLALLALPFIMRWWRMVVKYDA